MVMCRTAPRLRVSQKQPDGSKWRFLASPDQVWAGDHHCPGRISRPQTLAAGAVMVAFSVTSKPAADLSVTSARAAPASRTPARVTAVSIFMARALLGLFEA